MCVCVCACVGIGSGDGDGVSESNDYYARTQTFDWDLDSDSLTSMALRMSFHVAILRTLRTVCTVWIVDCVYCMFRMWTGVVLFENNKHGKQSSVQSGVWSLLRGKWQKMIFLFFSCCLIGWWVFSNVWILIVSIWVDQIFFGRNFILGEFFFFRRQQNTFETFQIRLQHFMAFAWPNMNFHGKNWSFDEKNSIFQKRDWKFKWNIF